jgi:hypothetical protein
MLAVVKLAVSTDAHSIDAFQCVRFGIDQARRAWLTGNDVLNAQPLADFAQAAEAVNLGRRQTIREASGVSQPKRYLISAASATIRPSL